MTTTTTTQLKQLSDYNPNGTLLGQAAADKVGFFGATPVVQQAVGTVIATTVAVSTTSAIWGFSTSTQANALITAVAAIQTALANLGLSS